MGRIIGLKNIANKDEIVKGLKEISTEMARVEENLTKVIDTSKNLNIQFQKNNDTQEQTLKNTKKVNDNIEVLTDSEKELQKIQKQSEAIRSKANAERSEEGKQLKRLQLQRQAQNKRIKEAINLEEAEVNSIAKLRSENKKLRKERDLINTSTDEGIAKIEELNAQIDKNNEVIKSNVDGLTQQKIGVGGYSDALSEFVPSIGQASGGVKNFGRALSKLLLNPIVLLVVAIVAAVQQLVKAFKATEAGQKAFQKGLKSTGAALDTLRGKFLDTVKDLTSEGGLKSAFENAKNGFKNFVNEVKNEGLGSALKTVGKNGVEAFKGITDEIKKSVKEAQNLVDLEFALFKAEQQSKQTIASLQGLAEIEQTIADDVTRSFAEREAAAERARKASEDAAAEEAKIAKQRFQLENARLKQAESVGKFDREIIAARNESLAASIQADNNLLRIEKENEKTRSELKQDRLERDLDILIDGFDNQKTINERIINDESKTFEQRRALLDETTILAEESFNRQIETIQKFTDINVNANDLIAESDAVALNAKIRALGLSEIIEGRLLEVIRERRLAVQDLNEAEKTINDARISLLQDRLTKEINAEKTRFLIGEQNEQQFNLRLLELNKQFLEQTLLDKELNAQQRLQIETKLIDAEIALQKAKTAAIEEEEATRLEIFNESASQIRDIGNSLFDLSTSFREREIAQIELQQKRELDLAGSNELARERILDKFDKKRRDLNQKQAKQDKAQAIFGAVIATALAITKALPVIPLAIAAGVLGAIQIAAIAAQPVPQFAEGVLDFVGGPAIVGEKGTELGLTSSGQAFLTPPKATMMDLPTGTSIIPHEDPLTQAVLQGGVSEEKMNELIKSNQRVEKAILSRPENITNLTQDGLEFAHRKGNTRIKYENIFWRR